MDRMDGYKMRLIVKKLQGGECVVDVRPSTYVLDIKRQITRKLKIPVKQQKLLFLGRTLLDERTVGSYPSLRDGSKLNLIIKKPDTLYEVSYRTFKKMGMSDAEAKVTASRFIKVVEEKFYKMSWDDVERLALDCLQDEERERQEQRVIEEMVL